MRILSSQVDSLAPKSLNRHPGVRTDGEVYFQAMPHLKKFYISTYKAEKGPATADMKLDKV